MVKPPPWTRKIELRQFDDVSQRCWRLDLSGCKRHAVGIVGHYGKNCARILGGCTGRWHRGHHDAIGDGKPEAVNRAYGSHFKLTKAPWHGGCPDFTTIYVMVSAPVGAKTLADILESLGGSRPPSTYIARNQLAEARGFTLCIPSNRRREFVYVNDTVPPVTSNPDSVRSIVIEEMTHALTTLGDFETDTIVSVLGEMLDVAYYDDWFDSNPRGLCFADLILLEMQVGRTVGQLSRRGASLAWLKEHARTLRDLVPVLQAELADFTDQRCQG